MERRAGSFRAKSIEREIETTGSKLRAPRRHAKASVILPLAAALVGVAILSVGFSKDRTDLVDPAGRPVARLETRGEVATARLFGARVAAESRKSWHLWGIVSAEEPPDHLGSIEGNEAFLTSPERFSVFAISLEDKGFSGTSPVGPVFPIARKK